MSFSVANVVSVVVFLVIAYASWRNGLYSTVVTLFIVVLSGAAALMCLGPMPRMLGVEQMGWYAPPVCFFGTFLLSVVILQTLANFLYAPRVTLPKGVDAGGAAVLGLVNAWFVTGVLMVGFALMPGTGGADSKVVFPPFLPADEFFVRSMALMSARTGSVPLDADAFLERARAEKFHNTVLERTDEEIYEENYVCGQRLSLLGEALVGSKRTTGYVEKKGEYPKQLEQLRDYMPPLPGKMTFEEVCKCPATHMPYQLFPIPAGSESIVDDTFNPFILIYDPVGGEYGHKGGGYEGKRSVFTRKGVLWLTEKKFGELYQGQRAAVQDATKPKDR